MAILQAALPFAPWVNPAHRRLPGTMPLALADLVLVDDAFAPQMAERKRLMDVARAQVLACLPQAQAAAAEALALILSHLPAGYGRAGQHVTRPDGVVVTPDAQAPLDSLSRLIQADACLLTRESGAPEHVLSGAALCFPSLWTLSQKLGLPMGRIHQPVASYDARMAARVQRMLDAIRPDTPLWRVNLMWHDDPRLFHPAPEFSHRPRQQGLYLRSERQCLVKLPETGAVLFLIHTAIVPRSALTDVQCAALDAMALH